MLFLCGDNKSSKWKLCWKYKFTDFSLIHSFRQLNLYTSPLFIGGVKDFERALSHPGQHISSYDFVGCMRDVFINSKAVSLSDAKETSRITNRCPRTDHCAPQPCQHGGKCLDQWFDYICECPAGYMGRNCQKGIKACCFPYFNIYWYNYSLAHIRTSVIALLNLMLFKFLNLQVSCCGYLKFFKLCSNLQM